MDKSERYCAHCGAINQPDAALCFACGRSMRITERLPEIHDVEEHYLRQRYRILDQVGKGGFSAVYKAEDTVGRRMVAIKAISLHGLRAQEIIEATDAFHREVQILTELNHPNLPHIHDHFSDTESWYIVMDFIQGVTLEQHLEQPTLPMGEIFDIALVLCDVLAYLHSRQPAVIFRDLKPANVILTDSGRIYLIDFGIARRFRAGQLKDTLPFGSPGYAAPEQYGRAQSSPRSDIYSLGVMLHQLLTGDDPSQTPFHFAAIRTRNSEVSEELEKLILSMVETNASGRPETIEAVRSVLQQAEQTFRWRHGLPASVPPAGRSGTPIPALPSVPPGPASFYADATTPVVGMGSMQAQVQVQMQSPRVAYAPPPYPYRPQPLPAHAFGAPAYQRPYYQPTAAAYAFGARMRNNHAIASLSLALAAIVVPPLLFIVSTFATFSNYRYYYYPLYATPVFWIWILTAISALLLPLLAVIYGHLGQAQAKRIPLLWNTRGLATTGVVLGYVFICLYALPICSILGLVMSAIGRY